MPPSKSYGVRAILLALLAKGESTLSPLFLSEDMQSALNTAKALGLCEESKGEVLTLQSPGLGELASPKQIHTGNSGITTTFILPILGLRKNTNIPLVVDCGEQMKKRPIRPFIQVLSQLGLTVESLGEDLFPFQVSGSLKAGEVEVQGENSQYTSALLLTLPFVKGNSIVRVKHLKEKPYVEMTLSLLKDLGISIHSEEKKGISIFYIQGDQQLNKFSLNIPGDFSSASYFLATGALLPSEITIQGLSLDDYQGDKRLISILQTMGAELIIQKNAISIKGGKSLKGLTIDANDIPDLVPTLAVLGTKAKGGLHVINISNARIKETDRLHSMTVNLKKMGADIVEGKDSLIIKPSILHGTSLHGFNDHRTVMALTVAALMAEGSSSIDTAESVNKTFPTFTHLMSSIGAHLSIL